MTSRLGRELVMESPGPGLRRELVNQAVRVRRHANQDVFQIRERRDVDEFAALDEGIQQRGAPSSLEAAGKEPILPANRDEAELIFGAIVVRSEAPVLREPLKGRPLIRQISNGLAHWGFRQDGPGEGLPLGVDFREQRDRLLLTQRPTALRIKIRSEEHTSELQSLRHLVCRILLEKKQTH